MKKNKYFVFTLGCQMNVSDSERITQKLDSLGHKSAPEKEADLVIVNACSVRQSAVDRIWGKIKVWQNQNKKILITGCVLPQDQKKFLAKNIIFFKINEIPNLKNILKVPKQYLSLRGRRPWQSIIDCFASPAGGARNDIKNYFDIKPKLDSRIAYIPIMTGCDNFCSYCAVPLTRGREVSRKVKDILSDIRNVLENGAREILLLGQNVNSFRPIDSVIAMSEAKKQSDKIISIDNTAFIKLLKTIDKLQYDFTFNFMSSNPHDMSDDLIKTFSKLKKWPHELHLAMQSGDDEILKKMNRKYTSGQYLALISKLKNQISNIILTTDIIVGFPGETEKEFENTVKVCKKVGFKKAYIGQYSPRPGTPAARLKDDVPRKEKIRRWRILNSLINQNDGLPR